MLHAKRTIQLRLFSTEADEIRKVTGDVKQKKSSYVSNRCYFLVDAIFLYVYAFQKVGLLRMDRLLPRNNTSFGGSSNDDINLTVLTLLFLFICVSNIYQIHVLCRDKLARSSERTYFAYYLLVLNVVSLFEAIVILPVVTAMKYSSVLTDLFGRKLLSLVHVFMTSVQAWTIAFMIWKRCSKQRVYKCTSVKAVKEHLKLVVLLSVVLSLPLLCVQDRCFKLHECAVWTKIYITILLVSLTFIPAAIILYCGIELLRPALRLTAVWMHRRKMYQRFTKLTFIMFSCFLVLNIPLLTLEFGFSVFPMEKHKTLHEVFLSMSWLAFGFYPVIYKIVYTKTHCKSLHAAERSSTDQSPNSRQFDDYHFLNLYSRRLFMYFDDGTESPYRKPAKNFYRSRRCALTLNQLEVPLSRIKKVSII